jgi:hypothetical protein
MEQTGMNRLEYYKKLALEGTVDNVNLLISKLDHTADIPTTKVIDYCLGFVENPEGIERLKHFLFHGSQMQRNYCTLYFARRNEWEVVNRAYKQGLIDYKQAYSR